MPKHKSLGLWPDGYYMPEKMDRKMGFKPTTLSLASLGHSVPSSPITSHSMTVNRILCHRIKESHIPISLRSAMSNEEDISSSLDGKFQEKIHYPPSPKGLPFGAVHDLNGISAYLDEFLFPCF